MLPDTCILSCKILLGIFHWFFFLKFCLFLPYKDNLRSWAIFGESVTYKIIETLKEEGSSNSVQSAKDKMWEMSCNCFEFQHIYLSLYHWMLRLKLKFLKKLKQSSGKQQAGVVESLHAQIRRWQFQV